MINHVPEIISSFSNKKREPPGGSLSEERMKFLSVYNHFLTPGAFRTLGLNKV